MVPGYDIEEAKCIKETEKALLIKAPDFQAKPFWIPKSALTVDSEITRESDEGLVCVSEWFAIKVGWL